MTVEPGPGFVTRLRKALDDAPATKRILIANGPLPLAGDGIVGVPAGVVAIPISDTVKEVVGGRVRRTVPREALVKLIGPWVFDREALVEAMTRVAGSETVVTDMIGLCEAARVRVRALPVR